jgi:hypothetical protein
MADGLSRDPDVAGRCPPYARVTSSSTPRFRSATQLDLLVLSQEHVETIIKEEPLVASPPASSPLAAWLNSGNAIALFLSLLYFIPKSNAVHVAIVIVAVYALSWVPELSISIVQGYIVKLFFDYY